MDSRLVWIFTLGQPTEELMKSLWGWTMQGGVDWVVVPIPEEPGQEGFGSLPDNEASFFGVR